MRLSLCVSHFCALLGAAVSAGAAVSLVSASGAGEAGNGFSRAPAISFDGRYVAFMSDAGNLVPDDTNGKPDIFLRDRATGAVTRVSVGAGGVQAEGASSAPAISADGRIIAFLSEANNLVEGDTNKAADIFLYDRDTGAVTRASVDSRGAQANAAAGPPALSAGGRYVAFCSTASNLAPGDGNGFADVFLHDTTTGATARVSVSSQGEEADGPSQGTPAVSADGRYVAFASHATNLAPEDGNGVTRDIFVRDTLAGRTALISRPRGGRSGVGESSGPAISADGRYVAFVSFAERLVPGDANRTADAFVCDRQTGETARVTAGNDATLAVSLSADGRRLAVLSHATDLAPGDANGYPDIFLCDLPTRALTRVNVQDDTEADDDSSAPAISGNGAAVAFVSWSSVLMPGRHLSRGDVFVYEAAK